MQVPLATLEQLQLIPNPLPERRTSATDFYSPLGPSVVSLGLTNPPTVTKPPTKDVSEMFPRLKYPMKLLPLSLVMQHLTENVFLVHLVQNMIPS